MSIRFAFFIVFIFIAINELSAQTNLDFEQGLSAWHTTGAVSVNQSDAHKGNACVKIESGSIFTRVPVSPLAIIDFEAFIKSSEKGAKGYSFVRFFDSKRQKILAYKSNLLDSTGYQQTGNYTEAPARASYMEIGIARDHKSKGVIYADDFSIKANALPHSKKRHHPSADLGQYMRPLWRSDTIYNETVLMYSIDGKPAEGKLMFAPDKVISVESFDLKTTYTAGKDYSRSGNTITRIANSTMPWRADTSFDRKTDLAWFNTLSQWVVVTYTHHDQWTGPIPMYKGDKLPGTLAKLRAGKPLRIVAYGMSITRGMDVSAFDTIPPYMPTYVDLCAGQLRKKYHNLRIKLFNAGLPGSTVDWGAKYAEKYVTPLNPDLVILDFGMNDFWRLKPEEFKTYVDTIMRKVRSVNPKAEFLLIGNMKFDPAYVLDNDQYKSFYTSNLEGYSHVLMDMEKKGVICLDMYAISDAVYQLKKAKDCLANPLHPNDYLARWYAQAMSALLIKNY